MKTTIETINGKTFTANGVIPKPTPSKDVLNRLLSYDPDTGLLHHKERTPDFFNGSEHQCKAWNKRMAGKRAFKDKSKQGYLVGVIFNEKYRAHRIIWKMVYGVEAESIDHINGIVDDNRISNIRSVSNQENCKNRRLSSINKTGTYGVHFNERKGMWESSIYHNSGHIFLGLFLEKEHAIIARNAAQKALNFSDRHGEITHCVDEAGNRVDVAIEEAV